MKLAEIRFPHESWIYDIGVDEGKRRTETDQLIEEVQGYFKPAGIRVIRDAWHSDVLLSSLTRAINSAVTLSNPPNVFQLPDATTGWSHPRTREFELKMLGVRLSIEHSRHPSRGKGLSLEAARDVALMDASYWDRLPLPDEERTLTRDLEKILLRTYLKEPNNFSNLTRNLLMMADFDLDDPVLSQQQIDRVAVACVTAVSEKIVLHHNGHISKINTYYGFSEDCEQRLLERNSRQPWVGLLRWQVEQKQKRQAGDSVLQDDDRPPGFSMPEVHF